MMMQWQPTLLMLLILTLAACTSNSSTTDRSQNDPHLRFINAAMVPKALPPDPESSSTVPTQTTTGTALQLPQVKPLEVPAKNIRIVGSTGMAVLNQEIYDQFVKQGFSGQIDIDATGSGPGIRLFCQREDLDIVTTARPMTDAEKATCQAQGRQLVEFPMAWDALVIVVNAQNSFVKDVTLEQLRGIFSQEKWSDVNPNWPDEPIEHFVSGPVSSTLDQLVNVVFSGDQNPILNAPNTQLAYYDEPLAQGLSQSRYGVGFFSHSFYKNQGQVLKPLNINGVGVSAKTVGDGTYPFPRKQFLYTDAYVMKNQPAVSQFINYYLTHVNDFIATVNYFPLTPKELKTTKLIWLNVMGIQTELVNNDQQQVNNEVEVIPEDLELLP